MYHKNDYLQPLLQRNNYKGKNVNISAKVFKIAAGTAYHRRTQQCRNSTGHKVPSKK